MDKVISLVFGFLLIIVAIPVAIIAIPCVLIGLVLRTVGVIFEAPVVLLNLISKQLHEEVNNLKEDE